MAHLDIYLERAPGFDWDTTPAWNTTVTKLKNKSRRANSNWTEPESTFVVPFGFEGSEHHLAALDVFHVCRGRKHAFRTRNWLFYRAQNWLFGYGDGVTREFQLGRLIELGGQSTMIPVYALSLAPEAPTPAVTVGGSAAGAAFNNRTGRVLFDVAPADDEPLRWTGWFDFWTYWATDDFPQRIITRSGGEQVAVYEANLEQADPPNEGFSS